jgi:circadian clock protein KaiB
MGMTEAVAMPPAYKLRLIVAGTSVRSRRAIENLRLVCAEHLKDNVDFEIVDIHQQPHLARTYQVVAAPTLLRLLPLPVRRIIGDLSERNRVIEGLELIPLANADADAS